MNESTRRRKIVAFILSGIFPGLGQFYNRQPVKGAAFALAGAVLSWLFLRETPSDPLTPGAVGGSLVLLACVLLAIWLWSLIDAWRIAGR